MCHQQSLAPRRCPTVPGTSHLAQHLKASTCGQKASERQQLPRNWLLGPAQAPLARWCLCPHPARDQDSPLRRMGTLCDIWFWKHCLAYSFGTGPAGQVCKSMTHAQTPLAPAASASCFCHLLTSHPPPPLPAQGASSLRWPHKLLQKVRLPKRSSPALCICW